MALAMLLSFSPGILDTAQVNVPEPLPAIVIELPEGFEPAEGVLYTSTAENVRKGPSTNTDILATVQQGTAFNRLDMVLTAGTWWKKTANRRTCIIP
ncbi:MAG TPA: SH3 domain-containing protein [Fastidiosipila sp.]|nr:SH3 domain-containing protein [Fastidiosipila sp.]